MSPHTSNGDAGGNGRASPTARPTMSTDRPERRLSHFARFNALARNGWLAILPGKELGLWHAYEAHANPEGIAFPDSRTLARMLGHKSDNHISASRQKLVSHGLLEVIDDGGGRGRRCTVRVLVPPTPKHSHFGSVSEPINTPVSGAETLPFRELNTPVSGIRLIRMNLP